MTRMQSLARTIIVVVIALATGCFSSGKHGPRGTNVGSGSDDGAGPWSSGAPSQALVNPP